MKKTRKFNGVKFRFKVSYPCTATGKRNAQHQAGIHRQRYNTQARVVKVSDPVDGCAYAVYVR